MNKISISILFLSLTACVSTSDYDAKFGDAVREAKLKTIIDPEAGKKAGQVAGIDGKAAKESINLYQQSFKDPPAATNVINIGGGLGGGSK